MEDVFFRALAIITMVAVLLSCFRWNLRCDREEKAAKQNSKAPPRQTRTMSDGK